MPAQSAATGPARLEALTVGASVTSVDPRGPVRVILAQWHGADCLDLTYRDASGRTDSRLLYRDDEPRLEAARTGNWLAENDLVICHLDKLSRNMKPAEPGSLHEKLLATDWDLVVVDEAHKMSATFIGGEVKMTQRHRLGRLLGGMARHFLLLTATPHNGKEEDFQLFMSLLDADRFEGRFRDGVHVVYVSDLMRHPEAALYHEVTQYVQNEFNRADQLEGGRRNAVGFALTILQRRLASSPEAIYQSLDRRRKRLEERLLNERLQRRGAQLAAARTLTDQELEDLDDAPDADVEALEDKVVDQATASRTIEELEAEIATLKRLVGLAEGVLKSGEDTKWNKLSELLQDNPEMYDEHGRRRKLVLFTEHRDTLAYLARRIRALLGRDEAVVTIAGGMLREERRKAQKAFTQGRDVQILVATDAAGEGINLQRFLEKIQTESDRLEGKGFDVLDRVFEGAPLRKLLIDAIRYGDSNEAKLRLNTQMDELLYLEHVQALWDRGALARDAMEHAEARRLQPQHIESFLLEDFRHLGGTIRERRPLWSRVNWSPPAKKAHSSSHVDALL